MKMCRFLSLAKAKLAFLDPLLSFTAPPGRHQGTVQHSDNPAAFPARLGSAGDTGGGVYSSVSTQHHQATYFTTAQYRKYSCKRVNSAVFVQQKLTVNAISAHEIVKKIILNYKEPIQKQNSNYPEAHTRQLNYMLIAAFQYMKQQLALN